jgi:hypothetical protein
MMFAELIKKSQKVLDDNTPVLLTAVGVIGTVTTAVLSARGSFQASQAYREALAERDMMTPFVDAEGKTHPVPELTKFEITKVTWKYYVPAVTSGATTVAAIICANRIGTKRTAAMAAAYTIADKQLAEYKAKIEEKFGINKATAVRDEIAQDQVKANPPNRAQVIVTGGGDVMMLDELSGRYFRSSIEKLNRVVNEVNNEMNYNRYCTLTEFYEKLGLEGTAMSSELGWNFETLVTVEYSAVVTEDDEPCIVIHYSPKPFRDFNDLK